MGFVRLGLAVLLLSGCFLGAACAQADDSAQADESQLPPTDYGAGYQIVMSRRHEDHAPAPSIMTDGPGATVGLDVVYPLIHSPLTPNAKNYNTAIAQLFTRWWKDIGGPSDNSQAADPGTSYLLQCIPVGTLPEDRGATQKAMLPGVISMLCTAAIAPLEAADGVGLYSGFNWLVAQRRPIRASDVFIPNSGWLAELATLANEDRQNTQPDPSIKKLDFADSRHWVLGTEGLGFAYSTEEFSGFAEGGDGGVVALIPWSKLAPYLRKDGIVPQADWSATAPPAN